MGKKARTIPHSESLNFEQQKKKKNRTKNLVKGIIHVQCRLYILYNGVLLVPY